MEEKKTGVMIRVLGLLNEHSNLLKNFLIVLCYMAFACFGMIVFLYSTRSITFEALNQLDMFLKTDGSGELMGAIVAVIFACLSITRACFGFIEIVIEGVTVWREKKKSGLVG